MFLLMNWIVIDDIVLKSTDGTKLGERANTPNTRVQYKFFIG